MSKSTTVVSLQPGGRGSTHRTVRLVMSEDGLSARTHLVPGVHMGVDPATAPKSISKGKAYYLMSGSETVNEN